MILSAQGGAAVNALVITPSNSAVVSTNSQSGQALTPYGVWVGGAGNLSVTMQSGSNVVFQGVAAGTLLPIRYTKVLTDSTTTLMVALF